MLYTVIKRSVGSGQLGFKYDAEITQHSFDNIGDAFGLPDRAVAAKREEPKFGHYFCRVVSHTVFAAALDEARRNAVKVTFGTVLDFQFDCNRVANQRTGCQIAVHGSHVQRELEHFRNALARFNCVQHQLVFTKRRGDLEKSIGLGKAGCHAARPFDSIPKR